MEEERARNDREQRVYKVCDARLQHPAADGAPDKDSPVDEDECGGKSEPEEHSDITKHLPGMLLLAGEDDEEQRHGHAPDNAVHHQLGRFDAVPVHELEVKRRHGAPEDKAGDASCHRPTVDPRVLH